MRIFPCTETSGRRAARERIPAGRIEANRVPANRVPANGVLPAKKENDMNTLLSQIASAASDRVLLAACSSRLTVALAIAWLFHAALSQANPASRMLAWRITASGVVLLAVMVLVPPVVRLPILPRATPDALASLTHVATIPQPVNAGLLSRSKLTAAPAFHGPCQRRTHCPGESGRGYLSRRRRPPGRSANIRCGDCNCGEHSLARRSCVLR